MKQQPKQSPEKQKKTFRIIIHNNNLQNGSRWTGSSSKYIVYPITPTGNMTKRALFTLEPVPNTQLRR